MLSIRSRPLHARLPCPLRLAPYPLKAAPCPLKAAPCPLLIPDQTSSEAVEEVKSKAKGKKSTGEKTARVTANLDEASLIVVSPVVLYL